MVNNDLYLEIDPKNYIILGPPKELELNWNNIGGLSFLSDDKLYDLSWAGYENSGFIKFVPQNKNKIRCFTCSPILIEKIKTELKQQLSKIRYQYECGGVIIKNQYQIATDDRSKILMQIKYTECKENPDLIFDWKTNSGRVEFTSVEFIKVFEKIRNFIQECFEIEFKHHDKINECSNVLDFCYIDLHKITWSSNNIIL